MADLKKMQNRRMAELIGQGEAVNIGNCPKEDGYYRLPEFIEGVDYCDAEKECWIWSIGKHRHTGVIHASTASDLYQNEEYDCLFLR